MAILGAIAAEKFFNKKMVAILIIITLLIASFQWHRNQTEFVKTVAGDALEGSTTWAHEQATRWFVPKPDRIPQNKIEGANYKIISWKTGEHDYLINGGNFVTENTMYYPGWEVKVDNILIPINYSNGKINYEVAPGQHQIKTVFTETPLRKTFDFISFITFIIVLSGLLFSYVVPKIFAKH